MSSDGESSHADPLSPGLASPSLSFSPPMSPPLSFLFSPPSSSHLARSLDRLKVEEAKGTLTTSPSEPKSAFDRSHSPSTLAGDEGLGHNIPLQSSRHLRLDVGGYKFSTTITTLTSSPDSMLAAMFSGRFMLEKTDEGCVFIDRDGQLFQYVLTWLRNGWLPPLACPKEHELLFQEARFYQLQGLIEFLESEDSLSVPPPTTLTAMPGPEAERFSQKEFLCLVNSVPSKKKVQLCGADLSGLNLSGVGLQGANMKFVNLSNTIMHHSNFQEADLRYANLQGADLSYIDLSLCNLQGANLSGAKLLYANLQGCNLQGADMMNVALQNANVQGANLQGANLQGANLHGTNLLGAKLQGASLHGITNVQSAKGLRR